MLKVLRIVCVCLLIVLGGVTWYSKQLLDVNKIDYNDHLEHKRYSTIPPVVSIEQAPIKGLIDDQTIHGLSDLVKQSKYILKITAAKEKLFIGNGVINNCQILNVIKGKDLHRGDSILVYEHVMGYLKDGLSYVEGAKPILSGKEYYVFLNQAPRPNKKGTYIMSSVNFGSFPVQPKSSQTIIDYDNGLSIRDTDKYAYIGQPSNYIHLSDGKTGLQKSAINIVEEYRDTYLRLQEEIVDAYK